MKPMLRLRKAYLLLLAVMAVSSLQAQNNAAADIYVKGSILASPVRLDYVGDSIWSGRNIAFTAGNDVEFVHNNFYFAINNDDHQAIRRLRGTRNQVCLPSEGKQGEDIMLAHGVYSVTLDLRRRTFTLSSPLDDYRISQFGSSVSNGEGADNHYGYAYLYNQQLAQRLTGGQSRNPFKVSEISIGGNTTVSLLNRYDDLTNNFGRYVIFGLSLGNEGIHGAKNPQAVFSQFRDNMLKLIAKVRADGKIPVVMNNYTRGDYNAEDYNYVKQMNLLIHQWNVPSVNVLGAIDDCSGRWAEGYQRTGDPYHPNTAGHREMFYAMVPSLFDAIKAGKPLPRRDLDATMLLRGGKLIKFTPEGMVHPFTISLRVRGNAKGRLFSFRDKSSGKEGYVEIDSKGRLCYVSAADGSRTVCGKGIYNKGMWNYITLTHYYAKGLTVLYLNNDAASKAERLELESVAIGDAKKKVKRELSELFFWRSAMNELEIKALTDGKMLNSSLELYVPMRAGLSNLAVSTNEVMQ